METTTSTKRLIWPGGREEYASHLRHQYKVSEKRVPFFCRWVDEYHHFCSRGGAVTDQATLDLYIEFVADRVSTWQLDQARYAVRLFLILGGNHVSDGRQKPVYCDWNDLILSVSRELKLQNKSVQTEKSYLYWLRSFSGFLQPRSPREISQNDIKDFLTYLVVTRNVAPATQKQAFNALLFCCRFVLKMSIEDLSDLIRSHGQPHLPVVLSRQEISMVIGRMKPPYNLMAILIYGGGPAGGSLTPASTPKSSWNSPASISPV